MLGTICAIQLVAYTLEQEYGVRRATERGDTDRLEKATQRFAWIGLETPNAPLNQGILYAQQGDFVGARSALQRSLDVQPTTTAYTALGQVHAREGNLSESLAALESALSLDPQNTTALHQMGAIWLRLGKPEDAVRVLTRARSSAAGKPEMLEVERMLERARQAADAAGSP